MWLTTKAWRMPVAVVASSACLAGAALAISESERTAYSSPPVGVWVDSDATDSISHLGPGGVDATVGVERPTGNLDVVQIDGVAYIVDEAGRVSRIDPATLDIADEAMLPSAGTQLVANGERLYAVDPGSGTVRELDPEQLTAIGTAVYVGAVLGIAVVDPAGLLWVADEGTGDVIGVDGGDIVDRSEITDAGVEIRLAVVGRSVVAIDPGGVRVTLVGGERSGETHAVPPLTPGGLLAPRNVQGATVLPVLGDDQSLALVDVSSGLVSDIDLGVDGHDLGTPEVAAGKVWIPDFTDGRLLVVEIGTNIVAPSIQVTGRAGPFEIIVNGDTVYVNDPSSEEAWAVGPNGLVIPASKYDPASPGGGTNAAPPTIPPAPELPPPPPPTDPDTSDPETPATTPISVPPMITIPPPPRPVDPVPTTPNTGGVPTGTTPGGGGPTTTVATTTVPTDTTAPPDTSVPTATTIRPTGNGRVNALAAAPGDRSATVTWQAPTDWFTVSGYDVVTEPGGQTSRVAAGSTNFQATGLTNGTEYRFTVTATSAEAGRGVSATAATVPAAGVPGPPSSVVATPGVASVSVTWNPPTGTVDGYIVDAVPTSGGAPVSVTVPPSPRSATISGLVDGATYRIDVRATNDGATGGAGSSAAVVPRDRPGAATNVNATATSPTTATVTWTAAPANGSPVTGYTIRSAAGPSVTVAGSATNATIAGLTTGSAYVFEVVPTNVVGDGAAAPSNEVLMQTMVPGAPGGVSAVAGDGTVTVSWSTPSGNGTSITGFRITGAGTSVDVGAAAVDRVFTGLANGTSYAFEVVALGGNGSSSPAAASAAVVPSGAPDAPSGLTATAMAPDTVSLSFGQQSPTNGTSVGQWRVTTSPGGTTTVSGTSPTIGGLPQATSFTVSVVAIGANGRESGPSNAASFSTPDGRPGALTGLTAQGGQIGYEANASWAATPGATSYQVVTDHGTFTATGTSTTWGTWDSGVGVFSITVTPLNQWGSGSPQSGTYQVSPNRTDCLPAGYYQDCIPM